MGIGSSNKNSNTGTSTHQSPHPRSKSPTSQPGTSPRSALQTSLPGSRSKEVSEPRGVGAGTTQLEPTTRQPILNATSLLSSLQTPETGSGTTFNDPTATSNSYDISLKQPSSSFSNSASWNLSSGSTPREPNLEFVKGGVLPASAARVGPNNTILKASSQPPHGDPGLYPVEFIPLPGRFVHLVPSRERIHASPRKPQPSNQIFMTQSNQPYKVPGPRKPPPPPPAQKPRPSPPGHEAHHKSHKEGAHPPPILVHTNDPLKKTAPKKTARVQLPKVQSPPKNSRTSGPRAPPPEFTFQLKSELETADRVDRRMRALKQYIKRYDGLKVFGAVISRSHHVFYQPKIRGTHHDLKAYHETVHRNAWYAALNDERSRKQIFESQIPLSATSELRKRLPKSKKWCRQVGKKLNCAPDSDYVDGVLTQHSIQDFNQLYETLKVKGPQDDEDSRHAAWRSALNFDSSLHQLKETAQSPVGPIHLSPS